MSNLLEGKHGIYYYSPAMFGRYALTSAQIARRNDGNNKMLKGTGQGTTTKTERNLLCA
jgi:hypothetical protein